MAFMTFYTPTYQRPNLLAICRRSVQAQTCRDFQHMVIVDDVGIGVAGMFRDIRKHVDEIRGEYVFILADDDRLLGPDGLEQVKAFARDHDNPPVIIVKNHKWGKIFPLIWDAAPEYTKIDTGNFIIRRDVFVENADQFGECYEGDYVFIHHLWEQGYPFAWFDYEFSAMQVAGRGKTEAEIMATEKGLIKVRGLKSFSARIGDMTWSVRKGQVVDMPPGVDWVRAGLVEVVDPPKPAEAPLSVSAETPVELAAVEPPEQAVSKRERVISKRGRTKTVKE